MMTAKKCKHKNVFHLNEMEIAINSNRNTIQMHTNSFPFVQTDANHIVSINVFPFLITTHTWTQRERETE